MGGSDEKGREPGTEPDRDLSARLKRLETQIEQKRISASPAHSSRSGSSAGPSSLGRAMQLSTEFTGAVIAGGILGWIFDRFLGTKPWGMLVLLMLGFAAGVYSVIRASGFGGPHPEPDDRKES
nr:AtpZ/AtpI family protein [Methylobacterium durans]